MASANIKPDKVSLSFGIETTNKTADGTSSTNSKARNKALVALIEAGVKENERFAYWIGADPLSS
jgi:uncharacterized protein YggE